MASAATAADVVASAAHQQHDTFNLVCLPIVVAVNAMTLYAFFLAESSDIELQNAWNIQIGVLNSYIFIDTIWILCNPMCVSALRTILLHHFVVFGGWLLVPHRVIELRSIATCLLSVEINTVFMIARKYRPIQGFPILVSCLNIGFYATWVFKVIFPYCCYLGYIETLRFQEIHGSYQNIATLGFVLLLFITALNVKWSYDLLFKVLTKSKKHPV